MYKLFDDDIENNKIIEDNIDQLLLFFNNTFSEYNTKFIKRFRKIDFYDLFFYMLFYNSSINETHSSSNYNFIINNNIDVSKNAFINRLMKLDSNYIKDFNDKFINFFYSLFKIDINNIITATDGSNIKLLACTNKYFKLNKNEYYTNATISCIYDVNNNLPLSMDINNSFNEVDNLIKQLNNNSIKKYKITNTTDRGYDDEKLMKYYLENNISFVSRLTKTNKFVDKLENNKLNAKFSITLNKKNYELHILKYTNIQKPDIKETKNELIISMNKMTQQINLIKNDLIEEQTNYNKLCNSNKLNNKELKELKLKKIKSNKIKELKFKKKINGIRVLKNISKNKINKIKSEIDKIINEKKKIKSKINKLETYEHSDFYILTNNLKYSIDELKNIYKKRWTVETSFKFDKTILNLNQMNNKNINLINQNVYIIQFIHIMNSFINKLLEKKIKKNHYLSKTLIFKALHNDIFSLIKNILNDKKYKSKNNMIKNNMIKKNYPKKINYNFNKLIFALKILLKNQNEIKNDRTFTRIKKRISNNKFNNRKKIINNG